jgi:hypothetical protein
VTNRHDVASNPRHPTTSAGARLVAELADAAPAPGLLDGLVDELLARAAGSTRFRAFLEGNRSKVRRKVREARDPDAVLDLRAELLVAARLLDDRRLELAFEATGTGRAGPDFGVTFRGVTRLSVEVTRRRGAGDAGAVVDAVLAKLRQLPPSMPNVVVVAVDRGIAAEDLAAAIRALRARVDARDPLTLTRANAERTRDFYDRFLRLAAVVAWSEAAPPTARAIAWVNPSARIALPRAALAAVVDRLAA